MRLPYVGTNNMGMLIHEQRELTGKVRGLPARRQQRQHSVGTVSVTVAQLPQLLRLLLPVLMLLRLPPGKRKAGAW